MYVNERMNKAYAHCDCCEVMHVCACSFFFMREIYAHGDCCEAMYACACFFACLRTSVCVL
jgi:hypothetical protein